MRMDGSGHKMKWYNKKVVEENTVALKIIENFCFNGLHCWPVVVFAVSISISQFIVSGVMVYLTSKLYSEGMWSKKFQKGGGFAIFGLGITGVCAGIWWSIASKHHIVKAMVLCTSLMSLCLSIPLAGTRGFVLGSFGGLPAGLAIGSEISNTKIGLIWGGIVGLIGGGVLGGVPVFWKLDSVDRYLNDNYYFINNPENSRLLSSGSEDYFENE